MKPWINVNVIFKNWIVPEAFIEWDFKFYIISDWLYVYVRIYAVLKCEASNKEVNRSFAV